MNLFLIYFLNTYNFSALEVASLDREKNVDLLLEKFSSKKGLHPTIDEMNLNEESK